MNANGINVPDGEVMAWVATLGKTRQEQLKALRSMLKHSVGDKLSETDASICEWAKSQLEAE